MHFTLQPRTHTYVASYSIKQSISLPCVAQFDISYTIPSIECWSWLLKWISRLGNAFQPKEWENPVFKDPEILLRWPSEKAEWTLPGTGVPGTLSCLNICTKLAVTLRQPKPQSLIDKPLGWILGHLWKLGLNCLNAEKLLAVGLLLSLSPPRLHTTLRMFYVNVLLLTWSLGLT